MTEIREDPLTLVEIEARSTLNTIEEIETEFKEIVPGVKINDNKFRTLCDNVQSCFAQIDNSMFELLDLKDKLLLQYLPRNVVLQITLVFSRLYRAYSETQVPVYELVRLVQLYSEPFDMKCVVLKSLYESNEVKKRMLNIALQRLTSMELHMKQCQEHKCIDNWEKMYIRLALPRSNARKWKFRIKTFREKTKLGYEHVMEWIYTGAVRSAKATEILRHDDNQLETLDERKVSIDQSFDHDNDVNNIAEEEIVASKIDVEVQAQPDFDDQQTSTEDILSTKSLIMRIYRPVGILKTKFQCIVYVHRKKYTTKKFIVPKDENQKTSNRSTKPITSNNIDKQQNHEFRIPMPTVLKRRLLLQTDIDPDAIRIDILGDDKLCGSLILSSEDLQMLDLPNLHSSISSSLIAADDNVLIKNDQLDFDQSSHETYKSWISHTPHAFSFYNDRNEPIGKLPLLMFWYNQIEHSHATKCTMTVPMETRIPMPKYETVIPPIIEESDEPTCVGVTDDRIEIIKATYENEIAKLHERYQTEIHRLTSLFNEILSCQPNELSESDENASEVVQVDLSNTNRRPSMRQQNKRGAVLEDQPSALYRKDLPKNFLDRYQIYLQRSIIHRHQLIAKVEQETALANERQMKIQHRLYKPGQDNEYDDLCLPAVFMPFRSGNVFNPRAYQFFHPTGATEVRLTQAPSISKFPSLPSRSVSVLNLFELSQAYNTANEKDRFIDKTT